MTKIVKIIENLQQKIEKYWKLSDMDWILLFNNEFFFEFKSSHELNKKLSQL